MPKGRVPLTARRKNKCWSTATWCSTVKKRCELDGKKQNVPLKTEIYGSYELTLHAPHKILEKKNSFIISFYRQTEQLKKCYLNTATSRYDTRRNHSKSHDQNQHTVLSRNLWRAVKSDISHFTAGHKITKMSSMHPPFSFFSLFVADVKYEMSLFMAWFFNFSFHILRHAVKCEKNWNWKWFSTKFSHILFELS